MGIVSKAVVICSRVTCLAHVPFHACCVFTHLEGALDGNESCLAKALLEHLGLWLTLNRAETYLRELQGICWEFVK